MKEGQESILVGDRVPIEPDTEKNKTLQGFFAAIPERKNSG